MQYLWEDVQVFKLIENAQSKGTFLNIPGLEIICGISSVAGLSAVLENLLTKGCPHFKKVQFF